MNWAQIEPQQGIFNFAPADREAMAWAAKGKSFNLIVRYFNAGSPSTDCSRAQLLPAWEISRILHFCDADQGTLIPDYFDLTFKQDLESYVNAIAEHFAKSPAQNRLLYFRIGVGEVCEGFPSMASGDYAVDRQQLISYGYSPSAWAVWQEEMLTYNQAAFSFVTVIYPLNGLDTEPRVGKPVQVEVAAWAASQGMRLGQQGLEAGSDSFVLQSLRAQYPKMFIQYQTNSAIGGEHLRSREISRLRKRMGLALSNGICEMQSIPLIKRFSPSGNTWLIVSMEVERLGGWFLTCMSAANQRAFHMVHAQCNSVSIENWEGSLTHVEASSWIRRNA